MYPLPKRAGTEADLQAERASKKEIEIDKDRAGASDDDCVRRSCSPIQFGFPLTSRQVIGNLETVEVGGKVLLR